MTDFPPIAPPVQRQSKRLNLGLSLNSACVKCVEAIALAVAACFLVPAVMGKRQAPAAPPAPVVAEKKVETPPPVIKPTPEIVKVILPAPPAPAPVVPVQKTVTVNTTTTNYFDILENLDITIKIPVPKDTPECEFPAAAPYNKDLSHVKPEGKYQFRKWTDSSGKHTTTAKYVRIITVVVGGGPTSSGVVLERRDGHKIVVPVEKLRESDHAWVITNRQPWGGNSDRNRGNDWRRWTFPNASPVVNRGGGMGGGGQRGGGMF